MTTYAKLFFADQDWKKPDRSAYMTAVASLRPEMATVLDLEREEQLTEVLNWADQISAYTNTIIIIPKVNGIIKKLPRAINGKHVILGFSVPTAYGGTTVSTEEFRGWEVHLLGGSPLSQLGYSKRMNVVSVDCNYHLRMANTACQFFSLVPLIFAKNPDWPTLREADGKPFVGNGRVEAFKRSCESILEFWRFHGIRITV